MNYFLAKTDPETYQIADLERDQETNWDGVHNYQAINYIKSWKIGDIVFIYHSQGENSITGLAQVIGQPEPDLEDPRQISWYAKVKFVAKFTPENQISLKEIKASGLFADWVLVRNGRLSVMPAPDTFIAWIKSQHKLGF